MNKRTIHGVRFYVFFIFGFVVSCTSPERRHIVHDVDTKKTIYHAGDRVKCALLDSEGILWFGTSNEGIYSYDHSNKKAFTNYHESHGLCNNNVNAIIEDRQGHIWFATGDGLCYYDRTTFHHIPIPWSGNEDLWGKGMNDKQVLCLIQTKIGMFWFGTWGGGAYRYDPKAAKDTRFTSFLAKQGRRQSDGLHRNVIQSILEDRNGILWFSSMTHGGVSRYDPDLTLENAMTHFSIESGLSDDMIRTSFQDESGKIWFGTLGNRKGGLDRIDPNTQNQKKLFTNFNVQDGLASNNISCIYEDKSGRIWVGSDRGSLCILDSSSLPNENDKVFKTFRTKDGQSFDNIDFVIEDKHSNIWFGGSHGKLFRYQSAGIHNKYEPILTDFTQKRLE